MATAETPATRVFFESGSGSRGRRIEYNNESEAIAAIQAGRLDGWEIGFGFYSRAYPADAEWAENLIAGAALPGTDEYRQRVRESWRRIAAEYLKRR